MCDTMTKKEDTAIENLRRTDVVKFTIKVSGVTKQLTIQTVGLPASKDGSPLPVCLPS